jgi:hypothetical protein
MLQQKWSKIKRQDYFYHSPNVPIYWFEKKREARQSCPALLP